MSYQSPSNIHSQLSEVKDFISLLKPRVMSLVVFTGLIGMLIAPGHIHPLIGFIAIICITFGSGASGAINMWYERELDAKMNRTKNRPLPQGRISPEAALDFAGILAVASVVIMAFAVNILSAFLLLCAILFYVFVYTIWLKPRTPQNIVIGGAAGAFPPLIGWAAVTGDVSLMPVLLFLITFLWTPPHFWALALYKNEDYKRAGIPMMPVIHGAAETKKQILIYSIILFIFSLLPSIISSAGFVYLAVASVMGLYFLYFALKLFFDPSEPNCKKMFGYSILYLFVIYLGVLIDKLI